MTTTDVIVSREPAHPDRVVGEVPLIDNRGVDAAVDAAREAQAAWEGSPLQRSEALQRWASNLEQRREELASLVAREVGKPIGEAQGEVDRLPRLLRYYAQLIFDPVSEVFAAAPGSHQEVERRALGTILLITPWNFPVAIPMWKMAPALAFGNSVLFRPSTAAAVVGARLVELAEGVLPQGVLHLLPTTTDQAERLLDDRTIDGVSFTGSSEVGRALVTRVVRRGGTAQAEMGGQNASIVLEDADLEHSALTIADAAMGYAGQKCTATSRVIVAERVAQRFVPLLKSAVAALRVGDPLHAETKVGPMISRSAREGVDRAVAAAVQEGGRLLLGGHAPKGAGWFYAPTLVAIDNPAVRFAQEETFGPAASVLIADSTDTAIDIANGTRYGLSGAVFGTDIDHALAVARRLRCGLVRVNASTAGVDYYVPFGGDGASSYGPREMGRAAKEFYTTTRTILVRQP